MLDIRAKGLAALVEDLARSVDMWHPDITAAYAGNDLEAVAANSAALNAEDFVSAQAGMLMPILLFDLKAVTVRAVQLTTTQKAHRASCEFKAGTRLTVVAHES
jgi:hypothetical protein